jgi:hypothetical protein
MMEGLRKGIDFAHLVSHLKETLESLRTADDEQKKQIQACLDQLLQLAALVRFQEERLKMLEQRLLVPRTLARRIAEAENPSIPVPPSDKKKPKRPLR